MKEAMRERRMVDSGRGHRHDGSSEHVTDFFEDILGGNPVLAIARRSFDQKLESLLIENPAVKEAVIDLAERHERSQRHPTVSRTKRHVLKESEKEGRGLFRKGHVGVATEDRRLWSLDRVDQSELRLHEARLCLCAA